MSGYSVTDADLILDATMGGAAYSHAGATHYLGLGTVLLGPTDTSGTLASEAGWTGYARLPMKSADWNAAAGGEKTNLKEMLWAECTGGGPETMLAWFLATAITAGTIVASGAVAAAVINAGITPKFIPGALIYKLLST